MAMMILMWDRSHHGSTECSGTVPSTLSEVHLPKKGSSSYKWQGECFDQLGKLHSLLEKGGISKDHYEELQKAILQDVLAHL